MSADGKTIMVARYATSLATGSLITLGLLLLMQLLIASGKAVYTEQKAFRWNPYVVEPRDPPPVETRREPPEKSTPLDPPPVPVIEGPGNGTGGFTFREPTPPQFSGPRTGDWGGPTDGDLLPIVKVQPTYPRAALERGLEGWVIVEFTVTAAGSVADPRVVESTHTLFERAAIDAALRFRYRPRIVNGQPVRVTGVQNLIRFRLNETER